MTISSNKWAGRAPEGVVLLRAFVPERVGPLATAPDDEILARVTSHVRASSARRAPRCSPASRWTAAMPTYTVGHLDRVAAVEAALPARVVIAGSALHGVGVPECIADGRRVARDVLAGLDAAAPLGR